MYVHTCIHKCQILQGSISNKKTYRFHIFSKRFETWSYIVFRSNIKILTNLNVLQLKII